MSTNPSSLAAASACHPPLVVVQCIQYVDVCEYGGGFIRGIRAKNTGLDGWISDVTIRQNTWHWCQLDRQWSYVLFYVNFYWLAPLWWHCDDVSTKWTLANRNIEHTFFGYGLFIRTWGGEREEILENFYLVWKCLCLILDKVFF